MSANRIASRMSQIRPFRVMELLARARELEANGRSIVHMEVGEPDFVTPEPIIAAGRAALEDGHTHYTPATGLMELRVAISDFYRQRYQVDVSPQRIVVTPGASGALQLALGVLMNPGEQVLMADPGYPCNRNFVYLLNGEPVSVQVDAETDYQLTAPLLEKAWSDPVNSRVSAVMLASPSNPTGTLVGQQQMNEIHALVQRRDATLIVDEIYHGLVYEGDEYTALSLVDDASTDNVFVINSFSKYFGMTGWRVGWLVAPEAYIPAIDKLAQNIFLAAATPSQYAALKAFAPETQKILEARKEEFRKRRDYLIPALQEIGFDITHKPAGAFYIYAGCQKFTSNSMQFCDDLLENAGVAITPGGDFGTYEADSHVRFAYTTSLEQLREGINRLKSALI